MSLRAVRANVFVAVFTADGETLVDLWGAENCVAANRLRDNVASLWPGHDVQVCAVGDLFAWALDAVGSELDTVGNSGAVLCATLLHKRARDWEGRRP